MQAITGIVLLIKFALAGIVGTRLLRIPTSSHLAPERLLGLFFLVGNLAGGLLVTVSYGVWASMGRAESSGWVNQLHGLGQFGLCFGYAMVALFTQQTFHRSSPVARAVAWTTIGLFAFSLLARLLHEGFPVGLEPGPFHWLAYGCRMLALAWASGAAFQYWIQMKRRVQLGLADPLVSNRFLLWGLWASGNVLTAFSEPIARVLYDWFAAGSAASTEAIQGIGGPLITITLCITAVLATYTTIVLWLAFFPTQRYRSWVLARAQQSQATS
jgi:hypothetical protein